MCAVRLLLKELQCPFRIRYSFVNTSREIISAGKLYLTILKPVKVTNVNVDHTCQLTIASHRVAKNKKLSAILPTNEGWNFFVLQMRENPHMDANQIRSALTLSFPHYVGLTAKMVRNIRRKARLQLMMLAHYSIFATLEEMAWLLHNNQQHLTQRQ
jgi:hypothetical protein